MSVDVRPNCNSVSEHVFTIRGRFVACPENTYKHDIYIPKRRTQRNVIL